MNVQERALQCVTLLEQAYPDAICSLAYRKPYELLISTRLAAQCTDVRVNIVTEELYGKFPTLVELDSAPLAEIERIVHPCGLYKTKAKDIKGITRMLLDTYGGVVPDTMEELLKLPGIGRKTANLVLGDVYHKPAIVCDTHCIRITNLLGLSSGTDPYKVEMQLQAILPPEKSNDFCHRLVLHGRAVCKARSPQCGQCVLSLCCHYFSGK